MTSRSPRIVIVDDNESASGLIASMLTSVGLPPVAIAENGHDGLALTRTWRPDLLIVNYLMDGIDGVQVIEALRADPAISGTNVILTSGDDTLADWAASAGAQDFLLYPFKRADLIRKVNLLLGIEPRSAAPIHAALESLMRDARGRKVLLDRDAARYFEVELKVLNAALKKNHARFPPDFMLVFEGEEAADLERRSAERGSGKRRRAVARGFTGLGVDMLAAVLKSKKAVELSVENVRAARRS